MWHDMLLYLSQMSVKIYFLLKQKNALREGTKLLKVISWLLREKSQILRPTAEDLSGASVEVKCEKDKDSGGMNCVNMTNISSEGLGNMI